MCFHGTKVYSSRRDRRARRRMMVPAVESTVRRSHGRDVTMTGRLPSQACSAVSRSSASELILAGVV